MSPTKESRLTSVCAALLFVLLVYIIYWSHQSGRTGQMQSNLRSPSLPTAMLDSGSLGRLLKRLGLVYTEKNDTQRFQQNINSSDPGRDPRATPFQRKREIGEYLYRANVRGKEYFPSRVDPSILSRAGALPVFSIAASAEALYDPTQGLLTNATKSGRAWEKPATLSVYRNQQLQLANSIGLRLTGQISLRQDFIGDSDQSYDIRFRNQYSVNQMPGDIVFPGRTEISLSGLVIEKSSVVRNALAMDIANLAGLELPVYEPVGISVNGEPKGLRMAREPVSREQWSQHLNKDSFDFYRNGDSETDPGWEKFAEIATWYKMHRGTLSLELAASYIDIENFSRNLAVMMYCGSSDWNNWAIYRDLQRAKPWRWISWNFDSCFTDRWQTSTGTIAEQDWYKVVASRSPSSGAWRITNRDIRTLIFVELMNNDPDYREYFKRTLRRLIEEELDVDYLLARLQHYRELETSSNNLTQNHLPVPNTDIAEFIKNRGAFILAHLNQLDF